MNPFFKIATITIVFFCYSCRPVYVPNTHNVPLLKEKKDASITVSYNDLQGAYALTDKFAVMLNLHRNNFKTVVDNDAKRTLNELAFGYYKHSNKMVYEVYGGYGRGIFEFENNSEFDNFYSANTNRIFLQGNIGYSNHVVDLVFSTRMFNYKLSNPNLSMYTFRDNVFENDFTDIHNLNFLFLEPAITVKSSWKRFKVFLQQVLPLQLNNNDRIISSVLIPTYYFGISINFSKRFNDEKKDAWF